MPIIINEVEIIAPQTAPKSLPAAALRQGKKPVAQTKSPYWIWRKLVERQLRLRAR